MAEELNEQLDLTSDSALPLRSDNTIEFSETDVELYNTPISLEKKVFGVQKTKENLNIDFNELTTKKFNIKDFFTLYKQLFYDIPKKGLYSHQKITEKSTKYIGGYSHPKNNDIDNLYLQIKSSLDKLKEIEGRHSIVKNNNIIKSKNSDKHYYIQDYKRRQIFIDVEKVKEYIGYPKDADIITILDQNAIDIIPHSKPIRKVKDLENPIKISNSISAEAKAQLINDYGSIIVPIEGTEASSEDDRNIY